MSKWDCPTTELKFVWNDIVIVKHFEVKRKKINTFVW